jgi:hypothetical protein
MMNYINRFRTWFESCNLREKLLVCAFSWAVIYAAFAITFFRSLDNESTRLTTDIKKTTDKIESWKGQLKYLREIPNTSLYKEWISHRKSFDTLKNKYKNLLNSSSSDKWDEIIKTVLSSYPNITIAKIQNAPEAVFQTSKVQSEPESIYQHQMMLTVEGTFPDTVGYLQYLEKTLPNIHWDKLTYEVKEYPMAEISMEFSILYDKNSL